MHHCLFQHANLCVFQVQYTYMYKSTETRQGSKTHYKDCPIMEIWRRSKKQEDYLASLARVVYKQQPTTLITINLKERNLHTLGSRPRVHPRLPGLRLYQCCHLASCLKAKTSSQLMDIGLIDNWLLGSSIGSM